MLFQISGGTHVRTCVYGRYAPDFASKRAHTTANITVVIQREQFELAWIGKHKLQYYYSQRVQTCK